MGQCELEYANYTLKTLPKGLKFFHLVSPSESLKVMGLTNIHHPDALSPFQRGNLLSMVQIGRVE